MRTTGSCPARPANEDPLGGARDLPPYWMAVLERARAQGDYATCADADRELRRLGVRVLYDFPRPAREEARDAQAAR